MKFLDIFPTTVGMSYLNEDLDKLYNYLLKEPLNYFSPNDATTTNEDLLRSNPLFKGLHDNILNKVKIYLNSLEISCSDAQIISSWGYFSRTNNLSDNFHKHSNSFLSGVFYIKPGTDIIFEDDKPRFFTPQDPVIKNPSNKHRDKLYNVKSKENLLLIFPSELSHALDDESKPNHERVSLAFNVIPKGEFGGPTSKVWL